MSTDKNPIPNGYTPGEAILGDFARSLGFFGENVRVLPVDFHTARVAIIEKFENARDASSARTAVYELEILNGKTLSMLEAAADGV